MKLAAARSRQSALLACQNPICHRPRTFSVFLESLPARLSKAFHFLNIQLGCEERVLRQSGLVIVDAEEAWTVRRAIPEMME
jgi:hypothetical protein